MMKLLWSFKVLRPPRLQFFTNNYRFFLALIITDFYRHLLPFISAVRICFACLLVVYLASRYLSASPSYFYCFLPLFFRLFVRRRVFCCLRAFLSVPTCFCRILCSLLFIFNLLVQGFVTPTIWAVKLSKLYFTLFSRDQLAGLRGQEGLLS